MQQDIFEPKLLNSGQQALDGLRSADSLRLVWDEDDSCLALPVVPMGSAAVRGAIIALLTATYLFDDLDPLGPSMSLKEMGAPNGFDLTKLVGL